MSKLKNFILGAIGGIIGIALVKLMEILWK